VRTGRIGGAGQGSTEGWERWKGGWRGGKRDKRELGGRGKVKRTKCKEPGK